MGEELQELRTVMSWDTADAESGAQRMAKAFEKIESEEKNMAEQSAANQKRASDARKKAADDGKKGGHGGHGGGGMGANIGWALHDFAEGRGTNALFRLGSAFGVIGVGAAVATQAVSKFSQAYQDNARSVAATLGLQRAMGEGIESSGQRNRLYGFAERLTGSRAFFDQGEAGTGTRQSAGGIEGQRREIQAAIKEVQDARTFKGTFLDIFASGITGHARQLEGLDAEQRGGNKLTDLDVAAGNITRNRTAAERLGAYGSERAGHLGQSQTQYDEEAAALGDANQTGKIGNAEYSAKLAAAASQQQIRDRDTNLAFDARDRDSNVSIADAGIRRRGYHVAVEEARQRMNAAGVELRDAPTEEASKAATGKFLNAQEETRQASLSQREIDVRLDGEKRIADFRGQRGGRARFTGRSGSWTTRSNSWPSPKSAGRTPRKRRRSASTRRKRISTCCSASRPCNAWRPAAPCGSRRATWPQRARSCAARTTWKRNGPNCARRRWTRSTPWRTPRSAWSTSRGSEESLRAQAEAARNLAQAQQAIALHEQAIRRERHYEMESTQGRTAQLRFAASGRDDLGSLAEQRAESRVAIERANQAGNPPGAGRSARRTAAIARAQGRGGPLPQSRRHAAQLGRREPRPHPAPAAPDALRRVQQADGRHRRPDERASGHQRPDRERGRPAHRRTAQRPADLRAQPRGTSPRPRLEERAARRPRDLLEDPDGRCSRACPKPRSNHGRHAPSLPQHRPPARTPVLQPGWSFTNRVYGLDDGKESYYVHPGLPKSQWPKVGNTSLANAGANPQMFAVEVTPREDESTLILLEVAYKGIAGTKPDKITPDCDVQLLTMPTGTTSTGSGSTNYQVIIPVPQPKATREYVATTAPNYAGVGVGFAAAWLPAPPRLQPVDHADGGQHDHDQLLAKLLVPAGAHLAGDRPGQGVVRAGDGRVHLQDRLRVAAHGQIPRRFCGQPAGRPVLDHRRVPQGVRRRAHRRPRPGGWRDDQRAAFPEGPLLPRAGGRGRQHFPPSRR